MKELFNRTSNPLFHLLCQIINEIYAGKKITKQEIQQRIKEIPEFQYNEAPEDERELAIIDKVFQFESPNSPASICITAPVPSLVTDTELAWLKSMLLDDNFDFILPEELRNNLINRLKNVTPLYNKSVWHGRPHSDSEIKPILRTIINALSSKTALIIDKHQYIIPYRLEYDLATGLYSLIAWEEKHKKVLKIHLNKNIHLFKTLERISSETSVQILTYLEQNKKQVTLELTPTRNSVERCLFLFSTYDKETHIDSNEKYIFIIQYYKFDEDDVISKIQSLGVSVVVQSPEDIRQKIISNILKMQNIYLQTQEGNLDEFDKNR